jgi:hypothetical protein
MVRKSAGNNLIDSEFLNAQMIECWKEKFAASQEWLGIDLVG